MVFLSVHIRVLAAVSLAVGPLLVRYECPCPPGCGACCEEDVRTDMASPAQCCGLGSEPRPVPLCCGSAGSAPSSGSESAKGLARLPSHGRCIHTIGQSTGIDMLMSPPPCPAVIAWSGLPELASHIYPAGRGLGDRDEPHSYHPPGRLAYCLFLC